jgi:hypothetical protein
MTEATEVDTAFEEVPEEVEETLAPTIKKSRKPQTIEAMSTEDLVTLFAKIASASNKQLADSILELRKEPVDLAKKANDEFTRAQDRKQRIQMQDAIRREQANCPHIAGCDRLSEMRDPMGRTSIIWHTSDSSETLGICTNCQRIFHENDPDYAEWRQKPSFNKQSRSGERFFSDPMKARAIARGEVPSN